MGEDKSIICIGLLKRQKYYLHWIIPITDHTSNFTKHLTKILAKKQKSSYAKIVGFIRVRMQICILRSVSICLSTSRTEWRGAGIEDVAAIPNTEWEQRIDWLSIKKNNNIVHLQDCLRKHFVFATNEHEECILKDPQHQLSGLEITLNSPHTGLLEEILCNQPQTLGRLCFEKLQSKFQSD